MSTLHIIGEFLDGWDQPGMRASARELTTALADTAPRGCASALLIASNSDAPVISHPKARVEVMALHRSMIPMVWRNGASARPLDGEFVHAMSPLAPLRRRHADDGSQTSITVSHTLAWDAPDALPKGQAKAYRQMVRRALKHSDVIVTPTHASAARLREIYGDDKVTTQVLPFAAPEEFRAGADAAERRTLLDLPDTYFVANTYPGETGRLEWILRAMEVHPELPPLILIGAGAEADLSDWSVLGDRVIQIEITDLSDTGAILAGAIALLMPQQIGDCLLPVYGALDSGVPVIHGNAPCVEETVLDGGLGSDTEEEFADALLLVTTDAEQHEHLSVLASDRSRMFSWLTTAWQLWEIHANI